MAAAEQLALAAVVDRPAPWVMEATGRLQRTWLSTTALERLVEKEATRLWLLVEQ